MWLFLAYIFSYKKLSRNTKESLKKKGKISFESALKLCIIKFGTKYSNQMHFILMYESRIRLSGVISHKGVCFGSHSEWSALWHRMPSQHYFQNLAWKMFHHTQYCIFYRHFPMKPSIDAKVNIFRVYSYNFWRVQCLAHSTTTIILKQQTLVYGFKTAKEFISKIRCNSCSSKVP